MLPERFGHLLAISGALTLHVGVLAAVMQPQAPIAIPQQQVIQVAMVSAPQEKKTATDITPPVPLHKDGMKKVPKKPEHVKPQQPEQQDVASLAPASGPQAAKAEAVNAALTEPVFEADYLRNTPPSYPPSARRRHVEGKVLLKVSVSDAGEVEKVEIDRSSGSEALDEAAREAVQRWRFVPARRGSEKVAADVIVPIIFQIKESS